MARTGGIDPAALWSPAARPRVGRPAAHTRAGITAVAIGIADAEGLAAVTIRRVASELGIGTMSLYTYVPDKETLVELMIDQVGGEHDLPTEATGDWRADLRRLAHALRAILLRHPWLPAVLGSRQTLGPNTLATMEYALAAMAGTDLDGQSKFEIVGLLTGFVVSYATHELGQRRSGEASDEALQAQVRHLRAVVGTGRYPHLARAVAQGGGARAEVSFDSLLDRMLTGLVGG